LEVGAQLLFHHHTPHLLHVLDEHNPVRELLRLLPQLCSVLPHVPDEFERDLDILTLLPISIFPEDVKRLITSL
jgi:hypothetical protein